MPITGRDASANHSAPWVVAYRRIAVALTAGPHARNDRRAVPDQACWATAPLGYRLLNQYRVEQPDWVGSGFRRDARQRASPKRKSLGPLGGGFRPHCRCVARRRPCPEWPRCRCGSSGRFQSGAALRASGREMACPTGCGRVLPARVAPERAFGRPLPECSGQPVRPDWCPGIGHKKPCRTRPPPRAHRAEESP